MIYLETLPHGQIVTIGTVDLFFSHGYLVGSQDNQRGVTYCAVNEWSTHTGTFMYESGLTNGRLVPHQKVLEYAEEMLKESLERPNKLPLV